MKRRFCDDGAKSADRQQESPMAANHWLVKSEPNTYSFADLERDGRTAWDGVRNNAAALHLKAMAAGDEVLFYHSQEGLAVVGVAKVVRTAYPDVSDPAGRFVAVDLAPVRELKRPVTLTEMKAQPALAEMAMIRQSRLSVSPVTADEWKTILKLAGG
jgi:predicted RNA-binding protein with PUA-like domain